MDTIEKNARVSVGDRMYNLIWKTRKGTNKLGWLLVFIEACAKLIALPIAFAFPIFYIFNSWLNAWEVIAMLIIFSPLILAELEIRMAFESMSSFIAVAGDMNRLTRDPSRSVFVKLMAKISYLVSGALALYLACAIWRTKSDSLSECTVAELDVLGNALAHVKLFWPQANLIWLQLESFYLVRDIINKDEKVQTSVSFALACKWALLEPDIRQERRKYLLSMISKTLKEFPELPEEVTMRLREALPPVIET